MKKAKRHFEEVPVEIAKRAAAQENGRPTDQTSGSSSWENIARRVTEETDPGKVLHLVEQLNAALGRKRKEQ